MTQIRLKNTLVQQQSFDRGQSFQSDLTEQQNIQNLQPIQSPPGFLNKFFTFHHLKMYFNFLGKETNIKKFKKYIPEYQEMITSTVLWEKFLKKKQQFEIAKYLFYLEKRGMISVLIMSLLAGFTLLVGVYLYSFLINVIIAVPNVDQAWKFGGIMLGFMVVKNFFFSYAENLSNNVSTNMKIHLQNLMLKSLLSSGCNAKVQKLNNIFLYDLSMVREFILFIPYIIVSLVQVIGSIIFVFINTNVYGLIILGLFVLMIIIHSILFFLMYKVKVNTAETSDRRCRFSMQNYLNLIEISYKGQSNVFQKKMQTLRKQQIKQYTKYYFLYSAAQVIGYACPTVAMIIYYTLYRDGTMTLAYVLKNVFYISAMFFPIRVLVFASTIVTSARKSIFSLSKIISYQKMTTQKDQKTGLPPVGLMPENLGDCYTRLIPQRIDLDLKKLSTAAEKIQMSFNPVTAELKKGQTILITGRVDCKPSTQDYLQKILHEIYKNDVVALIDRNPFIMEGTLRDNITLYGNYSQEFMYECLKVVGLLDVVLSFQQKENILLSANSVKAIKWFALRLELARALYHNADYLVIKRGLNFQQYSLIKEVCSYRKMKNKVNIILNQAVCFVKQIDYIILIEKDAQVIRGSPSELMEISRRSLGKICWAEFLTKFQAPNATIAIPADNGRKLQPYIKVELQGILPSQVSNAKALALSQKQSYPVSFIILLSILASAFMKHYILQMVTSTVATSPNIYIRLLWSAITFLILIVIRGIILSIYFSITSRHFSMRLLKKLYHLSIGQIFRLYNRRQTTYNQVYVATLMNESLFRDVQIGFYLVYQIVSVIVLTIVKTYPMAAVSPTIVFFLFIFTTIYINTLTKMLFYRYNSLNTFTLFLSDIFSYHKFIIGYKKSKQFFNKFTKGNRLRVIYDLNEIWMLLGQRFINQFIVIIYFLIILCVTIHADFNKRQRRNALLIQTAIAFVNQLSNTLRYFLKLKRSFQMQVIGLNQSLKLIDHEPPLQHDINQLNQTQITPIDNLETIQFRQLTLNVVGLTICRRINLQIKAKERIVITGDVGHGKQSIFGIFNNVHKGHGILGQVLINKIPYYQCKISHFNIIYSHLVCPSNITVYEIMKMHNQSLTQDELRGYLYRMFQLTQLTQTFFIESNIDTLSDSQRDLLYFVEETMVKKCQMLLMSQAFLHVDRITMKKMLRSILKNDQIKIVIHISNNPMIIDMYRKRYVFEESTIKLMKQ